MLSVINTYIKRDKGVEERGADTGFRMGERGILFFGGRRPKLNVKEQMTSDNVIVSYLA